MASKQDDTSAPLLESGEQPLPKGAWKKELRSIFLLALPCIVTTCSSQTMVVTDQVFVGHLGRQELAAAALGNTYFNLMWFFLLGCSTALDTLGSQAYGANDYSSLLTWTYAANIVLSGLCGVMAVGLWFARPVALFVLNLSADMAQGEAEHVAQLVSVFCRWLIPGLWPMMWAVVLMKFMQTQNCMVPPALVAGAACVLNVLGNWLCIHYLGFVGAPMATSATRFIQFAAYVAVVVWLQSRHHPGGWGRWLARSRRCWGKAWTPRILGTFLHLGIPGGGMLALEAGSFDITTAFAGALGIVEVSAHSTLLGICTYTFISFPFAVATAATIRVGNLLGAGQAHQASLAARLCVISGTLFQATCGVIMYFVRHHLGYLFTNDPTVAATVASIVLYGVAFQFCDGAFGTSQGVLRGMGRQRQLMLYNLIGFWGMGVAFGWVLTFKAHLGLHGLWTGIATGDLMAAGLCVVTWLLVDWRKEVKRALEHMTVAHDHEADVGHIQGEPDDWHDFLIPYKHELLAAGSASPPPSCSEPRSAATAAATAIGVSSAANGVSASAAAIAVPGGGCGCDGAAGGPGKADDDEGATTDPFSEAMLQATAKHPFGSPRFASPRCRV